MGCRKESFFLEFMYVDVARDLIIIIMVVVVIIIIIS